MVNQAAAKSFVIAAIAVVLSLNASGEVVAQQQPQEDRPRLVLNTLGPASRTRSLGFSNDSARLFAAGFDKTAHVWDVGWNQQGPDQATPIRTLRWEIARANRGLINVMAVSPTAERIAVGGQSARGANGDIILMDADRYEVERSLPPTRNEQTSRPGHQQSVTSIDFSPDGNRIISSSSDGNVWVWTAPPGGAGPWSPSELRPARGGRLFNEQPAIFLTNDVVAVAEPLDPNTYAQWRIVLYSVAGEIRRLRELPQLHRGRVSTMARSRDGRLWASGDDAGHVFLWTGGPQPSVSVLRHWGRIPSGFSFGPGGQLLAVSNYLDSNGQAVVELMDTAAGQMVDQFAVSTEEHCNACTISPDGRYLATHADDSQDVLVFRLIDGNGNLIPKPLSGQPPIRLHSRARRITRVAFKRPQGGQPSYDIGFSTTPDRRIGAEYSLTQTELLRFAEPAPEGAYIAPDEFGPGWAAVPAEGGSVVRLVFNGTEVDRIALNARRQGEFEGHFCIIPDQQRRPFAVAFGTTTQNGIYIYRLPAGNRSTRLLRYFRDHNGEVLSVGVSADGRYLVSGSEDQTIKIWSLAGLGAVNPNFLQTSVWGADFQLEGGALVVRNVLNMGIAFGRQLREGDVISSMLFADNGRQVVLNNPAQIKARLEQHPPWETVVFTVTRGGQQEQLRPTVPGWEPLMTLLVDNRGEWALFTPEGYYDASVAEGHRLFGWQINRGRNFTPRFLQAEALQKEFERPDVLRGILVAGSVFDALQAGNEPIPEDFVENIAAKTGQVPDVKITQPLASETFGPAQPITIQAEITTPPETDPDSIVSRATVGGRFAGEPAQQQDERLPDGSTKRTLTFQTNAGDQLTRLKLDVREAGTSSITNSINNSDTRFVRKQPPEQQQPRKLHVLALASNRYSGDWDALDYPVKDVNAVVDTLYDKETREVGLYEMGQADILTNERITPTAVEEQIRIIKEELTPVGPEDIVLIYLSGHGVNIEGDYFYIPSTVKTNEPEDIRTNGIHWPLLAKIADFRCHVIWMLDTCDSGAAVKTGVRNAEKHGSLVFAAARNEAFESEDLEHGHFTAKVLDGLDGGADGHQLDDEQNPTDLNPGIVSIMELAAFVIQEVKNATQRIQEPCITPADLQATTGQIELVKVQ